MSHNSSGEGPSVSDKALQPIAVNTTETTDHTSPLTTPVNYYGTIEFSDKASEHTINQNNNSNTSEKPVETPRPAVRKKIQQASKMSAHQPAEAPSEKMIQVDNTIDIIGQQQSALSKEASSVSGIAAQKVSSKDLKFGLAMKKQQTEDGSLRREQEVIEGPTRSYPKKVLFIIANEFCERFSYYGLRTVLVLYFKTVLGFSESSSAINYHMFATLCYLTPILGAILGDSILGKYKTILYLSVVYFLGEVILVLSSVFWDLNTWSILMTWAGLLLIGIGTGGIKPCVAAFAGDQFQANETKWRENFFSLFYGAINLGSLISMFLTPLLRSNYQCVGRHDCYALAFGLPCLLIFIATIVFLLAHNYYYVAPLPKENIIAAFCRCTWLALRRKISGERPYYPRRRNELVEQINHGHTESQVDDTSPTNSRLSMSSSENESKPVVSIKNLQLTSADKREPSLGFGQTNVNRQHWLYLAADQYDRESIEEFRSVLGLLLIFLPTPVYWCLFDQQGSLWTLQATRMDGRLLGTNLVLEPDQMMVANPLLLLTAIPIFQFMIYPSLERCNLITSSIQRMTTGGLIAALSFVASALIEFQIQAHQPHIQPMAGHADLLLVNGLAECSLNNLAIANLGSSNSPTDDHSLALKAIESLRPLSSQQLLSLPASNSSNGGYKLTFKLSSHLDHPEAGSTNQSSPVGCPFDAKQDNELAIGLLPDQAVRLVYIDHGNGKLTHKIFNESLALPQAKRARVRLLYEFFGSYSQAQKRDFFLISGSTPPSNNQSSLSSPQYKFDLISRDGQVMLSDYLDIDVHSSSERVFLYSSDPTLNMQQAQPVSLELKPGTRNLLILQQVDASHVRLRQELLQDNDYRISLLYQLIPYSLISMSEVMFSITGLEFSYAQAPPNLKSLILAAWSLTTAIGNILTVAVESWHPFSDIAHDFLFYAALMAVDMVLFAYLGYRYQPYQPYMSKSQSSNSKLK